MLLLDLAATRAKKDHTEALHVLQASNEGTRLGADLQRLRLDLENEKRTTAITMEHSNQVRLDDHALRAEVQRLKDELTTMHAQSETEKRAIISEWQATRDNMAANHLQDVMKLSNEARDKQLALGREHEEILARTDHQHRMQMQDKEREFTEKMAEARAGSPGSQSGTPSLGWVFDQGPWTKDASSCSAMCSSTTSA